MTTLRKRNVKGTECETLRRTLRERNVVFTERLRSVLPR